MLRVRNLVLLGMCAAMLCSCARGPYVMGLGHHGPWDLRKVTWEESRAAQDQLIHQPSMDTFLSQKVREAWDESGEDWQKRLRLEDVGVTLIDLRDPKGPRIGNVRGDQKTYPASVIKMVYMLATYEWLREGRISWHDKVRIYENDPTTSTVQVWSLDKALEEMIGPSNNEATDGILDLLTGTESGPEMSGDEWEAWKHKRWAVERYVEHLGLDGIFAIQKTWSNGPKGRETQFLGQPSGQHYEFSNSLTTNATARLLYLIETGQVVDREACRRMKKLMRREKEEFVKYLPESYGGKVPRGAKMWSKAGWISTKTHQAAIFDLGGGRKIVLVIFTVHKAVTPGQTSGSSAFSFVQLLASKIIAQM
ncbi:MAG: serine hydrolase [bacterium]